jgi:hypothetical protein
MGSKEGEGGTTSVTYPDPIYPPGWDFSNSFFNTIMPQLMGGAQPTYPGNVDPGLSETMQTAIRMAQGYAQSPAPYSLGQAGGTLGAYMNPQMAGAGWGTSQPRPSYMQMPPNPGGQAQGSYNPWANASPQQSYGYGTSGQQPFGGFGHLGPPTGMSPAGGQR